MKTETILRTAFFTALLALCGLSQAQVEDRVEKVVIVPDTTWLKPGAYGYPDILYTVSEKSTTVMELREDRPESICLIDTDDKEGPDYWTNIPEDCQRATSEGRNILSMPAEKVGDSFIYEGAVHIPMPSQQGVVSEAKF